MMALEDRFTVLNYVICSYDKQMLSPNDYSEIADNFAYLANMGSDYLETLHPLLEPLHLNLAEF